MPKKYKGTHLNAERRTEIQHGIEEGKCKAEIARLIHCDPTTVSKEIMKHRQIYASEKSYPVECAEFKTCSRKSTCTPSSAAFCDEFVKFECRMRDHSPGVCTGCKTFRSCRYIKYKYVAANAQRAYENSLSESRKGLDLDEKTAEIIAPIIRQMLDQGRSPYEIIEAHPEFGFTVRTLYTYIDCHAFAVVGVQNINLRRKCGRKKTIRKADAKKYKKRKDNSYLKGHTWEDWQAYKEYMESTGRHLSVVEMDTMYNNVTLGPFVQTFKLNDAQIALAVFHIEKTAEAMVRGVDYIEGILGEKLFEEIFQVILTDRGSEFSAVERLEFRKDGSRRTHVFYCDAMRSSQKPHVENKHTEYRDILPKETDLYKIGLISQSQLNIVLTQLNSRTLLSIGDGKHTPFEYARFYYPELVEKLIASGISEIKSDYVILNPDVLDKKKRNKHLAKMGRTLKEYHNTDYWKNSTQNKQSEDQQDDKE